MKRLNRKMNYGRFGYYFILPFFIVFSVFQLYPMIYTINLSFTDFTGWADSYTYVGLNNFIWLWESPLFYKAVFNTFIIWIANFIPQLGIGIFLAAVFTNEKLKIRGRGFFKVVYYLPNMITGASIALLFSQLFSSPYGSISIIFSKLGLIPDGYKFLRDPFATRVIVSTILVWMWFGPTIISFSAGMLAINSALYEAARIDGASNARIFFKITLPLLRPLLVYTFVTSMVGGLQMFDIPYLFAGGGPEYATETIVMYIYKQAFTGQENYNLGAAGSVYLLIIASILSFIIFKVFDRKEKDV